MFTVIDGMVVVGAEKVDLSVMPVVFPTDMNVTQIGRAVYDLTVMEHPKPVFVEINGRVYTKVYTIQADYRFHPSFLERVMMRGTRYHGYRLFHDNGRLVPHILERKMAYSCHKYGKGIGFSFPKHAAIAALLLKTGIVVMPDGNSIETIAQLLNDGYMWEKAWWEKENHAEVII